jgi:hypothetical protein
LTVVLTPTVIPPKATSVDAILPGVPTRCTHGVGAELLALCAQPITAAVMLSAGAWTVGAACSVFERDAIDSVPSAP